MSRWIAPLGAGIAVALILAASTPRPETPTDATASAPAAQSANDANPTQPGEDRYDGPFPRVATIAFEPIGETSGIIKSQTYEDVYWVHNDSGDEARLFAINGAGRVIYPEWLSSRYHGEETTEGDEREPWPGLQIVNGANIDWEDITLHDGILYVADMGNNGNARRDLGIYVIPEPNPRATDRMRARHFIPVVYPDQSVYPAEEWHFDCEALWWDQGSLYLLTKHRMAGQIGMLNYGTKLYRLPTMDPNTPNELELVATNPTFAAPTAAELSPNGEWLAVLGVLDLRLYPRPTDGSDDWLLGRPIIRPIPRSRLLQAEAICWDDAGTLRIANEQRGVFTYSVAEAIAGYDATEGESESAEEEDGGDGDAEDDTSEGSEEGAGGGEGAGEDEFSGE